MKKYGLFFMFMLLHFTAFSQLRGVVKDSIDGKPIPYVTISVENENSGTTSEENGVYALNVPESKNLIFSALGYEQKKVAASQAATVNLKPAALQLEEVVIVKRYETRQKEIGNSEHAIFEAFESAPRIDIKFFPYLPEYKKTRFIKQIALVTDSKLGDAAFKIHLYNVDPNGYPGEELLEKDFIVSVDKGVSKTKFSLAKFNLRMPKQGIFVGFEKLLIERNKIERTVTNPTTKETQTQISYAPFMLYNSVKRDFQFTFTNGKWVRKSSQETPNPLEKIRLYEPAITIILTN